MCDDVATARKPTNAEGTLLRSVCFLFVGLFLKNSQTYFKRTYRQLDVDLGGHPPQDGRVYVLRTIGGSHNDHLTKYTFNQIYIQTESSKNILLII